MIVGIAQRVEHHHGVGHGRENRAEPVFAVEPLGDEGHGASMARWRMRLGNTARPRAAHGRWRGRTGPRAFCCGAFGVGPSDLRRLEKQFVDPYAFRIARARLLRHQHQQRHDDGAAQ